MNCSGRKTALVKALLAGVFLHVPVAFAQSPEISPAVLPTTPHASTIPAATVVKPSSLAAATKVEQETLERMLKDASWPRRAIAALRLERFEDDQSQALLKKLLRDPTWQVRAFAIRCLAQRHVGAEEDWFAEENEPRVLRAALRYRYDIDSKRLARGIESLAKSSDLKNKMLAAELAAASGDAELKKTGVEAIQQIILRMNRGESGALSPRLALLTGQTTLRRPLQWQSWLMKTGKRWELQTAALLNDNHTLQSQPSLLGRLEPEQFAGLETYMATLGAREVDLAILLDCTASMGREIAAAQAGIDDMVLFVHDMVSSLRVGLIAYRDRGDEFETKGWEFSDDLSKLRSQLWQLAAEGGGDGPEAVHPAMKLALMQLHWRPESEKVMVIVGDAPPRVGYGGLCIALAKRAHEEAHLTTHVIQARNKDVKHFPEIAEAGGGRCVSLTESDSLMAEVTGLTLGDRFSEEFREFFRIYLELCR